MTDVATARAKLTGYGDELDKLSRDLADTCRKLEPVAKEHDAFVAKYEIGLWRKHLETGQKFPSEAMRLKLAHDEMKPELLGEWAALTASRDRMRKRISDLKSSVESQRSILSALKSELEAVR